MYVIFICQQSATDGTTKKVALKSNLCAINSPALDGCREDCFDLHDVDDKCLICDGEWSSHVGHYCTIRRAPDSVTSNALSVRGSWNSDSLKVDERCILVKIDDKELIDADKGPSYSFIILFQNVSKSNLTSSIIAYFHYF